MIEAAGEWSSVLLRHTRFLKTVIFTSIAVLLAACGSGADERAVPPGDATPADAAAIQRVDFTTQPDVQRLTTQVAGSVEPRDILFSDLTGDGRDEAVVPVSSGGTAGNLAFLVFTMRSGQPLLVLTRTLDRGSAGGIEPMVEDGRLFELAPEYGPSDPFCCPSVLKRTVFRWDGSMLQVAGEERIVSTPGPKQ
jgi:hypothetical protein